MLQSYVSSRTVNGEIQGRIWTLTRSGHRYTLTVARSEVTSGHRGSRYLSEKETTPWDAIWRRTSVADRVARRTDIIMSAFCCIFRILLLINLLVQLNAIPI